MATASHIQTNFNGGELSPAIEGRIDINKYTNGCYRLRNFIPLVQGPARRRSGTRHVAEVKDSTTRCWLVPFQFSDDVSFILEFGHFYIRFYTNHGLLLDGGLPYEIVSPWETPDLTAADGTFRLWMEQSGDVIYIASGTKPVYKLVRLGNTNWSLTEVEFRGGPFIGVDPDETRTVYASAATGAGITLTASSAIFNPNHVGSLFLLESKSIDGVAQWEVGKTITLGAERRSDGNVYEAMNAATTGTVKPVHTEGARYDGDTGVQWQYLHSGYGIAKITAVAPDGLSATADVVSRIPSQAVGAPNATTRWSFAEFSADRGYPSHVTFFRERLVLLRNTQCWMSVAADFENFSNRDGAQVTPDMAISINIASEQINDVAWVAPSQRLLVGTVGNEFAIGELASSDPLGPANIQAQAQTSHGSRRVRPVRVNDSTLFVQKSGRKLREIRFTFESDGYATTDLTVLADHVTKGQVVQMAYQQEPHSIVWCAMNNGELVGFTFNREQDVLGWHVHPLGGNGIVESVACIPSPDGARDDLWLIVRRTINGQSRRYVEFMERDWIQIEGATIQGAFFVDSGLTFDGLVAGASALVTGGTTWAAGETGAVTVSDMTMTGADEEDYLDLTGIDGATARVRVDTVTSPTTANVTFFTAIPPSLRALGSATVSWARDAISGLAHLEGQTVQVLADGATHPDRVVTGGQITLQRSASVVQVGLGYESKLTTMRIEAGGDTGTVQGRKKRITDIVVRLLDTLGGKCGRDGGPLELMMHRTSAAPMDGPPPVVTGDTDEIRWPDGYETEARVTIVQDQPLPMTVVAVMPKLTA